MEIRVLVVAILMMAAVAARAWTFEEAAAKARAEIDSTVEESARRREAVRKSCSSIIERETALYRAEEAAELDAAAKRQGALVRLVADFRRSFTESELREIKRANGERKRLHLAGVHIGSGGLIEHWEARIADVVRPRYRTFAPSRKTFQCPEESRPSPDYFGPEPPSEGLKESLLPPHQRNALLPPAGTCWAKDGGRKAVSIQSLVWFIGGAGRDLTRTTVYAAACAGPLEWRRNGYDRDDVPSLRYPTCVLMDLLDGSLPAGPAPRKYRSGPEVVALQREGRPGWELSLPPSERESVESKLIGLGVRDCVAVYNP